MVFENILGLAILGAVILLIIMVVAIIFVKNQKILAKFGFLIGAYSILVSFLIIINALSSGRDVFLGIVALLSSVDYGAHVGNYSQGTAAGVFFLLGVVILLISWKVLKETMEEKK